MSGRAFVDSNILLYADDASSGAKQQQAIELIGHLVATSRFVISTQVLQEYFVNATRKLGVPAEDARRRVEAYSETEIVLVRPELILAAIDLHRLHSISFWDAVIVKSAAAARCERLLTEDLSNGQVIDGVRIENPFVAAGAREPRATYGRGRVSGDRGSTARPRGREAAAAPRRARR